MPNNALIAAECANLTGGVLDSDGFARCKTVEHIPQAAYIRTGLRVLAQGSTLDEVLDKWHLTIRQKGLPRVKPEKDKA